LETLRAIVTHRPLVQNQNLLLFFFAASNSAKLSLTFSYTRTKSAPVRRIAGAAVNGSFCARTMETSDADPE
jgi:hypothetical protein